MLDDSGQAGAQITQEMIARVLSALRDSGLCDSAPEADTPLAERICRIVLAEVPA